MMIIDKTLRCLWERSTRIRLSVYANACGGCSFKQSHLGLSIFDGDECACHSFYEKFVDVQDVNSVFDPGDWQGFDKGINQYRIIYETSTTLTRRWRSYQHLARQLDCAWKVFPVVQSICEEMYIRSYQSEGFGLGMIGGWYKGVPGWE